MEAALAGLASTVKHSATREAIVQAREVFKKYTEVQDVPVVYVREKCLVAIELAFDHGNEKHSQYAVDAIQTLIRDVSFRDTGPEDANQHIATQILHSVTGIEQWNAHLQCKCVTVLVEMVCNNSLKITLPHLEECLQIYKRLFGSSEEESVRVACRAASSQAISSYFSNRYSNCDGEQEKIAVFMDVSKLLEELVTDLERMTSAHQQSLVLLDAVYALLSLNDHNILTHKPFSNLLWEKVCPLLILLLGVPHEAPIVSSTSKLEKNEPVGQGQAEFALSPSVTANPDTQKAMYRIVDQLMNLMITSPQLHSSLEALCHKAFLFPKIGQRMEALKTIRKVISDPHRIHQLAVGCVSARSQSLWRMMIVSVAECANPQLEVSIEAVRAVVALLQGMLDFTSKKSLSDEERRLVDQTFPTFERSFAKSFTLKSDVSLQSTDRQSTDFHQDDDDDSDVFVESGDHMSETLRRLEQKFNAGSVPTSTRKSSEYDECSEKSTAQKFVENLCEAVESWAGLKNTLSIDEAILQFSSSFHSKFCAAHEERFKVKSRVQQEFLNTDAIYLTTYAALSYAARPNVFNLNMLKKQVLSTGCVVHVSESWLEKLYDNLGNSNLHKSLTPLIRDVVSDYDGSTKRVLSDVLRLRKIEKRCEIVAGEEKTVARWLMSGAWQLIVEVLSTFQGAKEKGRVREKLRDTIENSIKGMRLFACVAQQLDMTDRCGWIFASLVESSCCLEEFREVASTDEDKKWTCTSREQLLSMELVLDQAHVAIHAPNCWKHVIRCTEYVWELEKYIYGALCYEKTSRLKFFRKTPSKSEERHGDEETTEAADRSIENAIGDQPLSLHSINRALCVLIAKVDRFYAKLPRELCLPAFCDLCIALISSSENRIFYGGQKSATLTNSVTLLTRLSEVISTLSRRPLVHQIFIWPLVSSHFVKVCECVEESRMAATALADTASGLLIQEPPGLCFNQSLVVPFQTVTCSDCCVDETKEQLVCSLSSFVSQHAEKIGSGWKPLFGCLRAVRISKARQSGPQWAVVDVISAYLNINKPAVISASLLDCVSCIAHLLQHHEQEEDMEIAQATLRLLPVIYSLILNMYTVTHTPNYHLLHRCELRAKCLDEVEIEVVDEKIPPLSTYLIDDIHIDESLKVDHGPLPWDDRQSHEIASVELFLSYMEQLCGTLLTSETRVQTSLLDIIQTFLIEISKTTLGAPIGGLCMSNVVLPYVQKWIRRPETDGAKTLKQAVGKFTQTVVEMMQQASFELWADRLLRDICAVCIECCRHEKIASSAPAYVALIIQEAPNFTPNQWSILSTALWIMTSVTTLPIRTMTTYYLVNSTDESGDVGQIMLHNHGRLPTQQFLLAQQVFASNDSQLNNGCQDDHELPRPHFVCTATDGKVEKICVGWLVQSLFTHTLLQQIVASLVLGSSDDVAVTKVVGTMPRVNAVPDTYTILYAILKASASVALDVDKRPALCSLLGKSTFVENANMLKELVSANTALTLSLLNRFEKGDDTLVALAAVVTSNTSELKRVEQKICRKRSAMYNREHDENQYHLVPVTFQDELMYKLVSNEHVEQTYNEYDKHRDRLKPTAAPERKNPFSEVINEITEEKDDTQKSKEQEEKDVDEERLAAYREICLQPLLRVFEISKRTKSTRESLKLCQSAVHSLLVASPDLTIRRFAIELIDNLVADMNL